MRNYNFLSIILLGITLASCSDTKKKWKYFIFLEFKELYNPKESLSLSILNSNSKTIDSIIYYVNDKKLVQKRSWEIVFEFKDQN
jgi:hypothetical protein